MLKRSMLQYEFCSMETRFVSNGKVGGYGKFRSSEE